MQCWQIDHITFISLIFDSWIKFFPSLSLMCALLQMLNNLNGTNLQNKLDDHIFQNSSSMNFVKQLCRAVVSVSKRVWRSSRRRRRWRRWRMTRRSGESLESAGALCRVPAPSRLSQRSKKGLRSADCWWNNSLTFTRSLCSPKTLVAKFCSATKKEVEVSLSKTI